MLLIFLKKTIYFFVEKVYNLYWKEKRKEMRMKKIFAFSPLIITVFAIVSFCVVFSFGVFDKPIKKDLSTYTLREIVKTSKLTSAKYIQNGIANYQKDGKKGKILYYAYVMPTIDFSKIEYDLDHEKKMVRVTLQDEFDYEIELLNNDSEYKRYYYPRGLKSNIHNKEADYICKEHARKEAEANPELNKKAKESLEKAISAILKPLLDSYEYSIEFENQQNEGE